MSSSRFLICLLVVSACRGRGGGGDDEGESPSLPRGATRVPVTVGRVMRDTISDQIVVVGHVVAMPGGSATLAAPAAGVVSAVRVQVGSVVRRGELLLRMDVPELVADLAARQAAADAAAREAARLAALYAEGVTSSRALEEARAAASSAAAALAAARALVNRTQVRSPLSGGVQSVLVQPGERVEAGTLLVSIVKTDTVDVVAAIPPVALARLQRALPAVVKPDGVDRSFPGRVAGLSPAIDSLSGTGQIVIRVANPGGHVVPGSGATATITLGVLRDALIVPEAALVLQGDSMAVFVLRPDSSVVARRVRVGARRDGRAQVEGAVQPGDRVAASGAFGLADGMRVVPRDTAP